MLASLAAAVLSLLLSGRWWGVAMAAGLFGLVLSVHARLALRPSAPFNRLAAQASGVSLLGLNLTIAAAALA